MSETRGFEIAKGFEDKEVNLPQRKTAFSAGYDFECAVDTEIPSMLVAFFRVMGKFIFGEKINWNEKETIKELKPTIVPTGIKCFMGEDEVLELYNRSSNPLKRGLILGNSVGIIDSDYYGNEDNDGHIGFMFYNFLPFPVTIKKGEAIGQGIFKKFLKMDNDSATGERTGGYGSTTTASTTTDTPTE